MKENINRMRDKRFVFNQDCNDVNYAAQLGRSEDWVREWYRDAYTSGADVFVADVALPDIVQTIFTPTGEIFGERFVKDPKYIIDNADNNFEIFNYTSWYRSLAELKERNTDVLKLACEEARKAGIMILAGMRMSDAHHGRVWTARSNNALFAQFVMDHPEWCNTWEDGSLDATLNYAVPEVQAHRLQILRELAENYDIDGLELDWMRWCRHFPDKTQRDHLNDLTHFVEDVRIMLDEVAKKKGIERMVLGHRVPITMEESLNIGCDVETWAKKGYADYLAPMDFLLNDLNTMTDEFVKAVKGTECLIYPGFGSTKYSFGFKKATYDNRENFDLVLMMRCLSQYRATAANWYAWGAAGGSSFNMYCWKPEDKEFYDQAIAILSDPVKAYGGSRHYVYLPAWKDGCNPTGNNEPQVLVFNEGNIGQRQVFKFRMADGRNGEALNGTLSFRIYDAEAGDKFDIDLNGKKISSDKFSIEYQPEGEEFTKPEGPICLKGGPFVWPPNLCYRMSLKDCPPFRGDNELGIILKEISTERNIKDTKEFIMEALEIKVL